jgi:hypothetical protein
MSFPRGYRVIISARRATLTELEEVARSFADPLIALNAEASARSWKALGVPIITATQPDALYTGWTLTPSNDVEFYAAGQRQFTKVNHYEKRHAHAYGLDGDALEERRH